MKMLLGANSSTTERTLNVLCSIAETDEIRRDLDLELYGLGILDSLATVELMIALSEEFGMDISPAELDREEWATPRKIVAYIERRVG